MNLKITIQLIFTQASVAVKRFADFWRLCDTFDQAEI